jgi:hypothetical protein
MVYLILSPHRNFLLFMKTKVRNYLMRIITEAEIFLRNVPFLGKFAKERNYPFTQQAENHLGSKVINS